MTDLDLTPVALRRLANGAEYMADSAHLVSVYAWQPIMRHAQETLRALADQMEARQSTDAQWQKAPEGWRDMDSAPTTGGQVLLYGHWKQFHGTKDKSNHVNCGHYANGWVCEGRYNEDFIAVAWQPMPSPPILNRARGEGCP